MIQIDTGTDFDIALVAVAEQEKGPLSVDP